jgi:hypothetical protein
LTLTDAKYVSGSNQNAYGGCVLSSGTVNLIDSTMTKCKLAGPDGTSKGGAIHASSTYFNHSRISDSSASSAVGAAAGGAVRIDGSSLFARYSTFENNAAHSYSQNDSGSGGAFAIAGATVMIQHCTVSGNRAERAGGVFAYGAGADVALFDSTISGNAANNDAIEVNGAHIYAYNTTVAFNRATNHASIAGVQADSIYAESSIIADNFASDATGSVEADVKSTDGFIGGGKNLILAAIATTTPADTSTACPRLAPLLDNGGSTRTHALLSGNAAVDAGGDSQNLGTDQRGLGFDRVVGAAADIGAYEWSVDSADEINRAGFECD